MHPEAYQWCEHVAHEYSYEPGPGLDVGGRDNNGSVRGLFTGVTSWDVVDMEPGGDVTIRQDARNQIHPSHEVTLGLCTEVLEHVQGWPALAWQLSRCVMHGGLIVVTTAGPTRERHHSGGWDDGWYRNINPGVLTGVMHASGCVTLELDVTPNEQDVRWCGRYEPEKVT